MYTLAQVLLYIWAQVYMYTEVCNVSTNFIMYFPDEGGHLDLLWFPVTWMWVGVGIRLHLSVPDFVYTYFLVFCW